jgi:predicted metal-dependent HD superfamily phosphohydrolase
VTAGNVRPDVDGALREARALAAALPSRLRYHDARHTFEEVLPAARALAEDLALDRRERVRIEAAVAFHDLGFLDAAVRHERAGADLARRALPTRGFGVEDVEAVAGMILATRLPQRPATTAERVVADADLAVLASPDFLRRNEDLRLELAAAGRPLAASAWLRQQRRFLLQHRYHTAAAERRFGPARRRNAVRLGARLRRLSGDGPPARPRPR